MNANARRHLSPIRTLLVVACLGLTCGCRIGPEYAHPCIALPDDWSLAEHPRLQGEPANLPAWWQHFHDPVLDQLVGETYQQNLSLREAGQRILEARAYRGVAVGNLFPQQQSAVGGYAHAQSSSNVANFFSAPGVFQPDLTPDNWNLGLSAAWELDFWGRYRRAVEVADARVDASVAAYDDALVLLLAELATNYIDMRTYERRIAYAVKNVEIQEGTLRLAKEKLDAGLSTAVDVGQAETNLGQTQAILPQLEVLRRHACHRLAVLLGQPARDLGSELGLTAVIPQPTTSLALTVPADLLRRRPDVRRAERELAAQSAKIGIAMTDLYPQLSLTGNIGWSAEELGKLFDTNSITGLIGPQFNWKILHYGRIRNNIAAEQAAFTRLCYAYRATVLNAHREAEDAQVSYLYGFDRAHALQRAVNGARVAVETAERSNASGVIDFNRVYLLQRELVNQQDLLATSEGAISVSLVALFKAMGGGWELRWQDHSTTDALAWESIEPLPSQVDNATPAAPAQPLPDDTIKPMLETPAPSPRLSPPHAPSSEPDGSADNEVPGESPATHEDPPSEAWFRRTPPVDAAVFVE